MLTFLFKNQHHLKTLLYHLRRSVWVLLVVSQLPFILMMGCTSIRMTQTPRSTLEQQLEVKAFERAISQLPIEKLRGKNVSMELFGLNKDDLPFAKEFFRVWLAKQDVLVVQDQEALDLRLKVFLNVLAVDQTEVLLGTPEFNFLGIPIPAIAFYRQLLNRGRADLKMYIFDSESSNLIDELPVSLGKAMHDRYTILFIISWTKSDLDDKPTKELKLGIKKGSF
ncbi:MAG: hypothetical protein JSV38_13255 [Desulfobacterales bacterium]|nr:MAG: hypothetical protein JSV38_13255 [Desulfobacterales bacterium]